MKALKFLRNLFILGAVAAIIYGFGYSFRLDTGNNATFKDNIKNGIERIKDIPESFSIDKILDSIPRITIVKIREGEYLLFTGKLTPEEIKERISDLIGSNKAGKSEPIGAIKPIERVHVNENFSLSQIKSPNDRAVNDPGYKIQWAISYTESNKAWRLVKQKREVRVAVLDTGVDYTHPDLKNRVLKSKGYDFVNNDNDPMDDHGHGTHVAGIIAAEANNRKGISGIAGPLDVRIIPVKVLNSKGEGRSDIIAHGIRYAVDSGADIINLSLGTRGKTRDISNAIKYARNKGVFVVAAAGNDNMDADNFSPTGDNGVYAVSAITPAYKKAPFSNYGDRIQGAAPGIKIVSTVPQGGYEAWDGTSMSAPVVSGVAAIIKANTPELTPDQIEKLLNETAVDIMTKGKDPYTGYGLVDAYRAVKKLNGIN